MGDIIIETHGLTKVYGKNTVVDAVDLHVKKGRIYGLLGRNGAGKTTIMKMILGLTSITAGEIMLFGRALGGNGKVLYPRIGSIVETPGFYPQLTAKENLEVFALLRGTAERDGVKNALDVVGLPFGDKKPFRQFSLGMKQRLGIACTLLSDPELLILDEPTNGLDPIGIAEVRGFIRQLSQTLGKTVLISSHILSEISLLADDIGIIHEGRLLKESSLEALEADNQRYLSLDVSSASAAARALETLGIVNYKVRPEDSIRVYDFSRSPGEINRALVEAGVEVSGLNTCTENLEDYFKRITGGEGVA